MTRWVSALLQWFDENRRDMPWRSRSTPYRVWISEVMLQQTQVAAATPYFNRFVKAYPSVRALARADEQDVLKLWEGLGYYSRARNLLKAAGVVVAEHGGRVPNSSSSLQSLPGLGPYSAAAIASIAYGELVSSVDGNVARVFARFWLLGEDFSSSVARQRLAGRIEKSMPSDRPGDFNQAVMELGALVCLPKSPKCSECPLRRACEARKESRIGDFPYRKLKKRVPHRDVAVGLVERRGRVLVRRRPAGGLLGGLWEFPGAERQGGETLESAAVRGVHEQTGIEVSGPLKKLCLVRHAYSHFTLSLRAYAGKGQGRTRAPDGAELRWCTKAELEALPFSVAHRKVARMLAAPAENA